MSLTAAVQGLATMVRLHCPTVDQVHDYVDDVVPSAVLAQVGPTDPVIDPNTDNDGYEATLAVTVTIPAPDLRAAQRTGENVLHELAVMWLRTGSTTLDGAAGVLYATPESTSLETMDLEEGQFNRIQQVVTVGVSAG